MTSNRKGHPSLATPFSTTASFLPELPPIDALFFIDFDVKKGYTIAWKRTVPGVDVDGRVEYKSLPSGLHTVSEDLIYFVDGAYAGLSAFVNMPCDEEEARNARMIAVGVLVPLSYGRLGRAWRHAQGLKDLAAKLASDRSDTALLEKYWEANQPRKGDSRPPPVGGETPVATPAVTFSDPPAQEQTRKGHTRNRSASDGASLAPAEHKLSPYHPVWSLTSLLDKFGPLIFPIQRAALVRQRILISCHAPVHEVCDFVYNLSVLSNIPLSLFNVLPEQSPTQRLRPLFSIGVHDIPFLVEDYEASKRREQGEDAIDDEAGTGWIACTTDSILAMKDTLWDMLITLPPEHSVNAQERAWPVVECPRGKPVKATQRDLRRFNALRTGLARLAASTSAPRPESPGSDADGPRASTSHSNLPSGPNPDDSFDKVTEPLSWTALAYNGYMWWASAGEQLRSEEQEEYSRDATLLADLTPASQTPMAMPHPSSLTDSFSLAARRSSASPTDDEARLELAIIAYFHRLTTQMLSILSDIVDAVDEAYPSTPYRDDEDLTSGDDGEDEALLDDDDQGPAAEAITVDSRSVENMGLDVWSATDAAFVQDLMRKYFDRVARIEGKGVEVCGVRVC